MDESIITNRGMLRDCRKIDFIVRSDAREKFGGDLLQVLEYARILHDRGWDVAILPYRADLSPRDGSVIHYTNVDRIFDFLTSVHLAKGRRVFVTPIHHDWRLVSHMRRQLPERWLRRAFQLFASEVIREFAAFTLRSVVRDRKTPVVARVRAGVLAAYYLPKARRAVGRNLDAASAVFLLAEGEGVSLSRDFYWEGRNRALVPNAVDLHDRALPLIETPWDARSPTLVFVGRIEPRKRALELARAAQTESINLRFVGSTKHAPEPYRRQFESLVQSSPYLDWSDQLQHHEILEVLGRSRVLVNPSWVEVQSLVELEAAIMGCWVVATPGGHSSEWLGGCVQVMPSFSLHQLLCTARQLALSEQGPSACDYDHTWESAVSTLERHYRA